MKHIGSHHVILWIVCFFVSTATLTAVKDGRVGDFLIVAEGLGGEKANIYEITLDTEAVRPLLPPDVSSTISPLAVAVDDEDNTIYWTDTRHVAICKYKGKKDNKTDDSVMTSYSSVLSRTSDETSLDCLALDKIRKVLYFCHESADSGAIGKIDTSGQSEDVFISSHSMIPRAIVIDEQNGNLYWSDWGDEPGIFKASLTDPQSKTTIVSHKILRPNGLAIDFTEGWIYWADVNTKSIEKCRLDGSDRSEIYKGTNEHYFGLALNRNYLFFTDWEKPMVKRLSIYGGRPTSLPQLILEMPNGIVLVSRTLQESTTHLHEDSANNTSTTSLVAQIRAQRARRPSTVINFAKDLPETLYPTQASDFGNSTPLDTRAEALFNNPNDYVSVNALYICVAVAVIAVLIAAVFFFLCSRSKGIGEKKDTPSNIVPVLAHTQEENIYEVILSTLYEEENSKNKNLMTTDVDNYDEVSLKKGLLTADYEGRYMKPTTFLQRETEDGYLKPDVCEHPYSALYCEGKCGNDTEYANVSELRPHNK